MAEPVTSTNRKLSKLSRSIEGKIALITGAASGMGRATAHLFADEGARLILLDINEQGLQRVSEELSSIGASALCRTVDLSQREDVARTVTECSVKMGGLDILVNNAGLIMPTLVDADNFGEAWDTSIAVMTTAQAWAIRAALPFLRDAEHARVVNIASTEAWGATRYSSAYTVAKHASVGLTRSMAVDLGKEGITVNCVCPGPIRTAITDDISEEDKQVFAKRRTALRRYAEPEEVAHSTLSLVLPASSFITGATLIVDGGLTIRNA